MKAITIKQPWASLIIEGVKDIENRTWQCPKKYIGQRVLIHAGLSVDESSIDKISLINGELARKTWFDINDDKLPLGAIIGSVEIVDCVTNHSGIWAENSETNCSEKCRLIDCEYFIDWNCGEGWCASCKLIGQSYEVDDIPKECPHKMKIDRIYNWVLANPVKFHESIPVKGKLGFWNYIVDCTLINALIAAEIDRLQAEDSDVQVVDEKIEFSWFPNNGNCSGVFSSIEGAIKDAEKAYKNGDIEFDNDIEPIINIGPIHRFNLKEAVKNIAEGIEDNIYEQVHDFAFGCDIEVEADISKKDKDSFISEASNVLFPIIEKYMVVNPSFVCTPEMTYNLKTTVWLFLKKKAEEEKK